MNFTYNQISERHGSEKILFDVNPNVMLSAILTKNQYNIFSQFNELIEGKEKVIVDESNLSWGMGKSSENDKERTKFLVLREILKDRNYYSEEKIVDLLILYIMENKRTKINNSTQILSSSIFTGNGGKDDEIIIADDTKSIQNTVDSNEQEVETNNHQNKVRKNKQVKTLKNQLKTVKSKNKSKKKFCSQKNNGKKSAVLLPNNNDKYCKNLRKRVKKGNKKIAKKKEKIEIDVEVKNKNTFLMRKFKQQFTNPKINSIFNNNKCFEKPNENKSDDQLTILKSVINKVTQQDTKSKKMKPVFNNPSSLQLPNIPNFIPNSLLVTSNPLPQTYNRNPFYLNMKKSQQKRFDNK